MRWLISCLLFVVLAACAVAHDAGLSGMKILLEKGGAIVSVTAHIKDFGKLDARENFPSEINLVVNGKKWECVNPQIVVDKPNDNITLQARIDEPIQTLEVVERLFPDDPNSKTIVTVMKDGEAVGKGVLTTEFKSWTYKVQGADEPAKVSSGSTFLDFLSLGIHHILQGPDHLLFIFGLMLARPRIKELLKVATAFTIAHSITLSLSALNIFSMSPRIVEPLIALSIVAVAAEKFFKPNDKVWRTIGIAFFFGLIHGFGFAGALTEIGLKPGEAAVPLAAFNIGVELVQASLILITIPVMTWISSLKWKHYSTATTCCAVIISLAGAFWFVERLVNGS